MYFSRRGVWKVMSDGCKSQCTFAAVLGSMKNVRSVMKSMFVEKETHIFFNQEQKVVFMWGDCPRDLNIQQHYCSF